MTPTQAIQSAFKNAFTFSGRATRAEFWWFALMYWLLILAASFIEADIIQPALKWQFNYAPLLDTMILCLAIPMASVGARRLQDTGFHGWPAPTEQVLIICSLVPYWVLGKDLSITPYIEWAATFFFIAIFLACLYPSQPRPNRFGFDPHTQATA